MNNNPIWDCLVCYQPLTNSENPDKCLCCGFEHLPGMGMDEVALRELQKPRAAAYRTKTFLPQFDLGVNCYHWKDENGSIVLDTTKRLSFGTAADLENKTVWLDQQFARLPEEKELSIDVRIQRSGAAERTVSMTVPALTEPQLQKLGLRLNEKLELELSLKNESSSVTSAPAALIG